MKKHCVSFALGAVAMALMMVSCTTITMIGEVNMLSTRNVSTTFDYQKLATYSGGSKSRIANSKAATLGDAVNNTVKEVPGGEFLMNAKVYIVDHGKGKYNFAVEGDVWGYPTEKGDYSGFKIGDYVMWSSGLGYNKGKIVAIKDSETCIVHNEKTNADRAVKFDDLMHAESDAVTNSAVTKTASAASSSIAAMPSNNSGFNVGDHVKWRNSPNGSYLMGTIVDIKGSGLCVVKDDKNGLKRNVKLAILERVENE